MLNPTPQQHNGKPVLQISSARACFAVPDRLTPAYCGGDLVGYVREQQVTAPRSRVELERLRWGGYREAGGVRWVGD